MQGSHRESIARGGIVARQRSSLADEAYHAIRAQIVEGVIPPGTRVTVRPIAERMSLSSTPIKAALVALERDGVLVSRLHRGFFVPELSAEDVDEIYEMWEAIEYIASRRAALSRDYALIAAALAAIVDEQRERLAEGELDGFRETNVDFHRKLWVLCGNGRLQRTADGLLDQLRLGNSLSARLPGRAEATLAEHAAIVEAIGSGDPDAAEGAARRHVRDAHDTLQESLSPQSEDQRHRVTGLCRGLDQQDS